MRRSSELNNFIPTNFEGHDAPVAREEISQHLGELIGRHHELSLMAASDDIDTLRDMRRLRGQIKLAQFSLEHPDYQAVQPNYLV